MNFDQTQDNGPLEGNMVLACGGLAGWASYIRSCPSAVTDDDRAMLPYISRTYAIMRDFIAGTPDANTSVHTCDIPDSQLADKLSGYIPSVMREQAARDRNVPTSLHRAVEFLKKQTF